MNVAGALLYGLGNLFHPRMLWLMIWPMLVSLAIWGTTALVMWTRLALWLAELLQPSGRSASYASSSASWPCSWRTWRCCSCSSRWST